MKKAETTMTTETTMTENQTAVTITDDMTAQTLCDLLNKTEDKNLHEPIKTALEERLKEENKKSVKAGLEAFANKAKNDPNLFWTEFINDPAVSVRKFTENDDGTFELEPAKRRVTFSQIDKVYGDLNDGKTIAESKNYARMLAHITNNLYRLTCADLSEEAGAKCAVVRVTANINGEKTMREVDFSKASKSGIKAQMQAFLDTVMPQNQRILVCSADVNYVNKAFVAAKDGTVKTAKEKRTEAIIWEAVKVRKNNEAYKVESQADCHKEPQKEGKKSEFTEAKEEKMSKVPNRPESEAVLSKTEEA